EGLQRNDLLAAAAKQYEARGDYSHAQEIIQLMQLDEATTVQDAYREGWNNAANHDQVRALNPFNHNWVLDDHPELQAEYADALTITTNDTTAIAKRAKDIAQELQDARDSDSSQQDLAWQRLGTLMQGA